MVAGPGRGGGGRRVPAALAARRVPRPPAVLPLAGARPRLRRRPQAPAQRAPRRAHAGQARPQGGDRPGRRGPSASRLQVRRLGRGGAQQRRTVGRPAVQRVVDRRLLRRRLREPPRGRDRPGPAAPRRRDPGRHPDGTGPPADDGRDRPKAPGGRDTAGLELTRELRAGPRSRAPSGPASSSSTSSTPASAASATSSSPPPLG